MRREVFDRVVAAWNEIAVVAAGWTPGKITIATSPESALSPPGWVGALRLGFPAPGLRDGSAAAGALITAPDETQAARVREQLGTASPEKATERHSWGSLLPAEPRRILGPAELAYLDSSDLVSSAEAWSHVVEKVGLADIAPAIEALEVATGPEDVDEVDITDAQSPLFVIWHGDTVASVCGYRIWVGALAHMMVMSHPDFRGRGLAKRTASAATRHALDAGLVPQWRARIPASQAVARSLGYATVGAQFSVRLDNIDP